MLTLGLFTNIFTHGLNGLFLLLDSLVYWIVGELYELFYNLASQEFITEATYQEIANRVLVVIGVVMLFYLAYSLLKALVNPDELNKGTGKIVMNLVISLILIAVVPSIFTYAFKVQNIILEEQIIDKVVFGNTGNTLTSVGRNTAMTFFEVFAEVPLDTEIDYPESEYSTWGELRDAIIRNDKDVGFKDVTYLAPVFSDYPDTTSYTPIIGTLCGAFLVYVIFSFCLDLGIRVVKLAFYQIISPIPIMMRIIPEKKSVFDNWTKATLATFLEVFIRVFIMYIIAFLCAKILNGVINLDGLGLFGKIIVLMGIFAFAKQAPKLIGDVMGVDSGNIKLGVKDKIKAGGGYIAAAGIGAGVTAMTRNAINRFGNKKNWQDENGNYTARSIGSNLFRGARSTIAGAGSGLVRGGYGARSAGNFTDTRNAASQGAQNAVQARINRENYRANHQDNRFGAIGGHVTDTLDRMATWAGITTPLEQLQVEQRNIQSIADARKAYNDRLIKLLELQQNERNVSRGHEQVIAGVGSFKNLTALQNELERMKTTGKTSHGKNATANMIREMQIAEEKLKTQLKKDIANGYDKNGYTRNINNYDAQLKDLAVAYRTAMMTNYNSIASNITSDDRASNSKLNKAMTALENAHAVDPNQNINDFITDGHMLELYDGNNAIQHANSIVNQQITTNIQRNRNNQQNNNNS